MLLCTLKNTVEVVQIGFLASNFSYISSICGNYYNTWLFEQWVVFDIAGSSPELIANYYLQICNTLLPVEMRCPCHQFFQAVLLLAAYVSYKKWSIGNNDSSNSVFLIKFSLNALFIVRLFNAHFVKAQLALSLIICVL